MKRLALIASGVLLAPLVLLSVAVAGAGALMGAVNPRNDLPGLPGDRLAGAFRQAFGPVYLATTGGAPTIHDLGVGPSDAVRVEHLIAALNPRSPLVGQGVWILHLGQQFGIDPLLIAQWQLESGMATTGVNSPGNGGNMLWAAAEPYAAQYGCTPGAATEGHHWAACPSIEAGLGVWFTYVGTFYPPRARTLAEYARVYDPCSDPGNAGLPCGDRYAQLLLGLVAAHAGPPVAAATPIATDCGPRLPTVDAGQNLAMPPGVGSIMAIVFGGTAFPITQGWGPSALSGEPAYGAFPHFHTGIDFGAPLETPLYAPDDAVAEPRTYGGALIESLHLANGRTWNLLHLDRQVAQGPVHRGTLVGYSGNTGYSTGPHLHIELKDVQGQWVAPEQWACRNRA